MFKLSLVSIAIIIVCSYFLINNDDTKYVDKILIPSAPIQTPSALKNNSFNIDDAKITVLAEYSGKVLIEGKRKYFDGMSSIVPIDLIFVWGPLSKQSNRDQMSYSQSNRWYIFTTKNQSFMTSKIYNNAANTHIIPANSEILNSVTKIHKGDIIEFSGYLVNIEKDNHFIASSLTREDSGAGACEVLYLTKIKNISDQYIKN